MPSIHLFEAFGVELEYMVVDRDTLKVRPVVDKLLQEAGKLPGADVEAEGNPDYPNQVEFEDVAWSNELTLHVLELKTTSPAKRLEGLDQQFHRHVTRINQMLADMNCMLLPGGMHPTMDPYKEMVLWPHDYSEVYSIFNWIFDCRGHGWANLQAAHLNLPFDGDDAPDSEFGRLHAAIRFLLPILPALSASTPVMDARVTGVLDNRLEVYRTNSRAIPAAAAMVIPEPVFTRGDYERVILEEIYRQYAPHDPEGTMRYEWANSRGAIARFMRNTIEIRVLDVQECPAMDVAICAAITSVLQAIVDGRLGDLRELRTWEVQPLHAILLEVIRGADEAVIADSRYLAALGMSEAKATAKEVWSHLVSQTIAREAGYPQFKPQLDVLLSQGPLARRLLRACGPSPDRRKITDTYRQLADCLHANVPFMA
ncbi:MAG TPA: glutamate-cysteine ligase family protein [Phycisphaerales bacterium]|nr:glutamate-cysteine ligase family protein [Phycisphaerales bacterium]